MFDLRTSSTQSMSSSYPFRNDGNAQQEGTLPQKLPHLNQQHLKHFLRRPPQAKRCPCLSVLPRKPQRRAHCRRQEDLHRKRPHSFEGQYIQRAFRSPSEQSAENSRPELKAWQNVWAINAVDDRASKSLERSLLRLFHRKQVSAKTHAPDG